MISKVRRVVVTGLVFGRKRCGLRDGDTGVVSSLGCQAQTVWENVLAGECGITKITEPGFERNAVKIAATVSKASGGFAENEWMAKIKDKEIITPDVLFSFAAASQALQDAKWNVDVAVNHMGSYGVSVGCVHVSLDDLVNENNAFCTKGPSGITPQFISKLLFNTSSAIISKEYGFQGPNLVSSSACAASSQAIGQAFRMIRYGDADAMLTGGTEVCMYPIVFGAFERLNAITSKFNDNPKKASRPFDKDRSGFVMADGAAFLLLEEYEHAKQRNAKAYAEILGYGLGADAYHLTAPSEDGRGAIRCMKGALRDANLQTKDISYINAHATSTPIGDAAENRAIKTLFDDHARNLKISSTKGSTGHLQTAAGAIEAILTTLAVEKGVAPPTLNLNEVSSEFDLNYVPNKPQELSVCQGERRIALSNSFGFSGTNSCLCIGEIQT